MILVRISTACTVFHFDAARELWLKWRLPAGADLKKSDRLLRSTSCADAGGSKEGAARQCFSARLKSCPDTKPGLQRPLFPTFAKTLYVVVGVLRGPEMPARAAQRQERVGVFRFALFSRFEERD